MARASRTIRVAHILRRVNTRMAVADDTLRTSVLAGMTPEQAYRQGIADLLADVLHETGNYAGFNYMGVGGTSPRYVQGETDETRRRYYIHKRLVQDYRDLGGDTVPSVVDRVRTGHHAERPAKPPVTVEWRENPHTLNGNGWLATVDTTDPWSLIWDENTDDWSLRDPGLTERGRVNDTDEQAAMTAAEVIIQRVYAEME